jgi:hypothetical protein
MISRSFSSKESATTAAAGAGGPAVFFNFKQVVLTSPTRLAQDNAARAMEPWSWPDTQGASSPQGQAAALKTQPGWLKKTPSVVVFIDFGAHASDPIDDQKRRPAGQLDPAY